MWHCESKNSKHQNGPWPSRYLHGLTRRQPWRSTVRIVFLLGNQKSSPQSSSSIRPILGFFRLFGWEDPIFFGIKVWEQHPRSTQRKWAADLVLGLLKLPTKNLDTSSDLLQVGHMLFFHVESSSNWQMESWISSIKSRTPTKNSTCYYGWFHVFLIFADFQVCFLWRVPDFFGHIMNIPFKHT